MAIMWSGESQGQTLEVRSAGLTRRMYVDGVLHTQYHPKRPLTGDVWDSLTLGAATLPDGPKRALVLGVGGGACINLLERHFPTELVTGVELDPVRLRLAKRYFGVDSSRARLVRADAIEWIRAHVGSVYDYVVDDLFGQIDGEPVRAIEVSNDWLSLLSRWVSKKEGALCLNLVGRSAANDVLDKVHGAGGWLRYGSAHILSVPVSENRVLVLSRGALCVGELRRRIMKLPLLRRKSQRRLYRVRIERVF